LTYTNLLVGLPELDSSFNPLVWCPMMIKLKEMGQLTWTADGPLLSSTIAERSALLNALNDENFRGSLKEAYGGKSMSAPLQIKPRRDTVITTSSDSEDACMHPEDAKTLE